MSEQKPSGLLVVDKPAGQTSHDVVKMVRRRLRARAGHAGTLDPQATGVLLVCIGSATRLARFLQGHDKVYQGVIRLGWATSTYDAEGEPLGPPVEPPDLDSDEVDQELRRFVGRQLQRPPAYSAKKVRGEPAYRRARRGELVEPEPVEIEIHAVDLLEMRRAEIHVRVHCGAGTYVRTLAHDLGEALGCPAHLAALRRLRSGPFVVDPAVGWDRLSSMSVAEAEDWLVPPCDMLPEWPAAVVDTDGSTAVANGRVVEPRWIIERQAGSTGQKWATLGDGWVRVLERTGEMLAAAELLPGGLLQPRVVLT